MRKIRKISLTLVILPILQTGCMQDRTSKITPSNPSDKNVTRNLDKKDDVNITATSGGSDKNSSDKNISSLEPVYVPIAEVETSVTQLTDFIESEGYQEDEYISQDVSQNIVSRMSNIEESWSELSKEDEIIETAKTFIGTKYVWAANGPECFDCSGFTKYVFKENGITLPRYSGHQAEVGITVSYDELEKGDLVFFDTENRFKGKVNHVGIYIGDNKFIHASSAKKKVIITSFDEKPFYRRRFLRGERVINYGATYASL
jgi:cell wall-associated NlpC family hydrolase